MPAPHFSIIIPSLNDSDRLDCILPLFQDCKQCEVIVVEAGKEKGKRPSGRFSKVTRLGSDQANRATQMNLGADRAHGDILLFLHADTLIDPDSLPELYQYLKAHPQYVGGSYQFCLDSSRWRARLVELGVRLREYVFRLPYGDQVQFVRRKVFAAMGGYPEVPFLEDVIFIQQMRNAKDALTRRLC